MTEVLVGIAGLVIRIGIGILVRKAIATSQVHSAEARAQKVVLDAQVEAKTVMKQSLVDGNEQIAALRREAEEDIRAPRGDPAPGAPGRGQGGEPGVLRPRAALGGDGRS